MAGIVFLIVLFIALLILGGLTKAMGCGPFTGGLFAFFALRRVHRLAGGEPRLQVTRHAAAVGRGGGVGRRIGAWTCP